MFRRTFFRPSTPQKRRHTAVAVENHRACISMPVQRNCVCSTRVWRAYSYTRVPTFLHGTAVFRYWHPRAPCSGRVCDDAWGRFYLVPPDDRRKTRSYANHTYVYITLRMSLHNRASDRVYAARDNSIRAKRHVRATCHTLYVISRNIIDFFSPLVFIDARVSRSSGKSAGRHRVYLL